MQLGVRQHTGAAGRAPEAVLGHVQMQPQPTVRHQLVRVGRTFDGLVRPRAQRQLDADLRAGTDRPLVGVDPQP